jgi:hypothetical protein
MSKNKTLFIGFFIGIVFTFAILYLSGFVPKTGNYELVALKDHDSHWIYEIMYNTETGQVVSRDANDSSIHRTGLFRYRKGERRSESVEVVKGTK